MLITISAHTRLSAGLLARRCHQIKGAVPAWPHSCVLVLKCEHKPLLGDS